MELLTLKPKMIGNHVNGEVDHAGLERKPSKGSRVGLVVVESAQQSPFLLAENLLHGSPRT